MADGWWVRHDTIAVTGGTKVLTLVEQRAGIITLTGVLASNQLIQFTGVEGFWIVQNDTTGAFTTKAVLAGPTAGVTLTQGATTLIYCNGTDMAVTTSLATPASAVTFSPTGTIAATDVQAAIAELDSENQTAHTNLENTKQPLDATLTALAGASTAADKVPYFTGVDTVSVADFTSFGRTLVAGSAVGNTQLSDMAQSTIKGRAAGAGTGDPTDLTATQATAILDNVVGDSGSGGTKGLVPAPASGDAAANKFLKADGLWTVVTSVSFSGVQVFTASGTWTKPAGLSSIFVIGTGGGGGGGGADTSINSNVLSGAAGGTFMKRIAAASLGATETVTIGAGGAAGTNSAGSPTNGSAGGNTSFGAHATANGGGGGLKEDPTSTSPATGGSATGGDINVTGGHGWRQAPGDFAQGGASFWGGGSLIASTTAYGAGGGAHTADGFDGGGGVIMVLEFGSG